MCKILSVFHQYLWIYVFVWALAFCGLRIRHCASVDCSGTTGKIHMREIEVGQGLATDDGKLEISWFEDVSGQKNDVLEAFSLC